MPEPTAVVKAAGRIAGVKASPSFGRNPALETAPAEAGVGITAGTLAFCRYLWKELKTYRSMLEEQDQKETIRVVSEQIKPIYEKLD